MRQIETDGTRVRTLVQHDVDRVVLHRAVEIFLDGLRETVDLVDEDNVAGLKRGEEAREIAGLGDDGTGGRLHVDAHRLTEDVGERGLAESGRTREKHVVERFATVFRSLDGEHQPIADLLLPDKALEIRRTEPVIERTVAPIQLLA